MKKKIMFLFLLLLLIVSPILEVSQKIIYAEGISPLTLSSLALETDTKVSLHSPFVVNLSDNRGESYESTLKLPDSVDYQAELTEQQENRQNASLVYNELTRTVTVKWNEGENKIISLVLIGNQATDFINIQMESVTDHQIMTSNELIFSIMSEELTTETEKVPDESEENSIYPESPISEELVDNEQAIETEEDQKQESERLDTTPKPVADVGSTPRADSTTMDVNSHATFVAALGNVAITTINLIGDFNVTGNITAIPARAITILGNNYTIDFRNNYLYPSVVSDITVKNTRVLGLNYYGPINFNSGGASGSKLTYEDVTYQGSQLVASYNSDIYFAGTVVNESTTSYIGIDGSTVNVTLLGQQNIEASNVTFMENSTYIGSTLNSGVIRLTNGAGNITLESGAVVELTANGTGTGDSTSGIELRGKLLLEKDAQLTINTDVRRNYSALYTSAASQGIELKENAQFKVNALGNTTGNGNGNNVVSLPYSNAYIRIGEGASMDVKSVGTVAGAGTVVNMGTTSKIEVAKNASLNVEVDGTGSKNIIAQGNNSLLQLDDAKRVNLQFNGTPNTASRLISMSSSAGKLNAPIQKIQAWNRASEITNAADYNWDPIFNMVASYSTGNSTAVGNSINQETVTSFTTNFKTENFKRILVESVPDIDIQIETEVTDNPNDDNSTKISGTTNPMAYIQFSGDGAIPEATIPSPILGSTEKFTIQADQTGKFSYSLPNGTRFTAGNTITAYAFLGGKTATDTKIVLDKNPPVLETRELSLVTGDATPDPSLFVKEITDSNPNNSGFTYAYVDSNLVDSYMNQIGTHEISIMATDIAGNTVIEKATLSIFISLNGISGNDVTMTVEDLAGMDTEALRVYLLNQSQLKAWSIIDYTFKDVSSKLTMYGLDGVLSGTLGKHKVSLMVSAIDAGTTVPLAGHIDVIIEKNIPTGPTNPTNPTNPGSEDAVDRENDGTNNVGALRLDYVPSKLDFGSTHFSFKEQIVHAKNPQATSGNELAEQWLQVSDNRPDQNGWSVRVSQNGPLKSHNNEELTGAVLTIPEGDIYNQDSGNALVESGHIHSKQVALSTNEVTIFSAKDLAAVGKNISTNVWQAKEVSLKIPGGVGRPNEDYQNTINWSLVSGVVN